MAPTAGCIEVFEGQTDGVHQLMTSRACRIRPVLRHALAHRKNLAYRIVVSQRRHVRRWWWWWRAENIFENPFPALNRRSAVCIGRHSEKASLPKQTSTNAVVRQRYTTEVAAINIRNTVILRKPFVQECVIGVQKVDNTPILFYDAFQKQLGLLTESLPHIVIEVRKLSAVRTGIRQIAEIQPLASEIGHQRLGASVG